MKRLLVLIFLCGLFLSPVKGTTTEESVLDSYGVSNSDTWFIITQVHPSAEPAYSGLAQSFSHSNYAAISAAKFEVFKGGNPVGSVAAQLFLGSTTDVSTAVPSGDALATSEYVAMESLSASSTPGFLTVFSFNGSQRANMLPNTVYSIAFIAIAATTLGGADRVNIRTDSSSPSHRGTASGFASSAWAIESNQDLPFAALGLVSGSGGGGGTGLQPEFLLPATGSLGGPTGIVIILAAIAAVVFLGRGGKRR